MSDQNEDIQPTIGFIYCLHNPAFTVAYGYNVYKFGLAQDPASRLGGYTTPYVEPSRFVYVSKCVYDCVKAESLLFQRLKYSRLKYNREFFWCRPDMIEELFTEVVAEINEGHKFEVPITNVGWAHLGTIPHIRAFFCDKFSRMSGERISGARIERMYKSWCSRKKCKSLKSLKEHAADIQTHLDFIVTENNSEWWIYDLKAKSKEPFVEEYISQWWRIIPVNGNILLNESMNASPINGVIRTSWNVLSKHFQTWYYNLESNSDVPFDTLWYCLQKFELKCHWPVGILENVQNAVSNLLSRPTTIKLISEMSYEVLRTWLDTGNDIDILGLQQVLTSEETLETYILEETEQKSVYIVHLDLLYSKYIEWGRQRGHEILDKDAFVTSLKEKELSAYKSVYIKGVKLKGEKDQSDFISEYIAHTCIMGKTFKCRFKDLFEEYNQWAESRNRLGCENSHFTEILTYFQYEMSKDGTVKSVEGLTIKEKVIDIIGPLRNYLNNKKKDRASTLDQLQKVLNTKGRTKYKLSLLLVCSDNTILSYPTVKDLE